MPDQPKKSLKETAEAALKSNPSALGDPISLKAETSDRDPADDPEHNDADGDGGDGGKQSDSKKEPQGHQENKKKRDSKL